ncbi:methyl-accepting chemotaxis protein [Pseudomonas kuykendallii]|uniref:Methyl-accepting chemotaxis protein n=1 Tax=Pseudomonas kuykendallii TaxID=1007099 RepID=A0A1H2T885_9PSED|nr:methyl-accepting chemotaxis protein [Pseudomonas kuykendallii]MCQ4272123.1 methyl-accepting chemotaxis protein [Pseudomonas kuykendallii]SDW40156.1 methyl-accepting chemotaxis protein [Pseudomonas kuykendallii]
MGALLVPGMRVLERFSFARKFQLLFLLFVLPLCFAAWVIVSDFTAKLDVVAKERGGMRAMQALDAVQQAMVEQRNLFARWKGTEEPAKAGFEQQAGELDRALQEAARRIAQEGFTAQTDQHLQALQALRSELAVDRLGKMALPDGLERYQKFLLQLQRLRDQVATDSGLILDPWLDTYLMMDQLTASLPRALERLGSFFAQGHGAVVSQHFTLQSRVVIRDLRRALDDSRASLQKAAATLAQDAPWVMPGLRQPYDTALQGLDAYTQRIDREVFESNPIAIAPAPFAAASDTLRDQLLGLQQALYGVFEARMASYREDALHSLLQVIGAFAVLALFALYVLLCLNASIRRSTASITEAAQGLRDGDLRVRVAVHGEDDLAQIALALNAAVLQLRDSLKGVDDESHQLGDTVHQLYAQAQDSLGEVEQQQVQLSQIATAATQLAATAQSVAQSCEEAAVDAVQTREVAMQSRQRSTRTGTSMHQLGERLGEASVTLGQLREQAQQINRIVDVIKGIAEQTNLLALNAAIEAARAGEQGRGFAVVADEVRSLSQRTQESTKEIGQTVGDLQSVVGQAVALMEEANRQAEGDVGSVLAMGGDLEHIAESVQRVSDRLAQIATAAEQQAATADEVSGNIQQIDQAASQLLSGAQSVSGAAEQMQRGSEGLRRNTGRFQLS